MKRLFGIRNNEGKLVTHKQVTEGGGPLPCYFNNKVKAKHCRNTLGEGYHITRGPDHMGRHGHRIARMRLQPKKEM